MKKSDLPVGCQQGYFIKQLIKLQIVTIIRMKKTVSLHAEFRPLSYSLELDKGNAKLTINGQKIGRPSHRITLHQRKLKIINAQIASADHRRNPIEVDRINHLPTFEQVRMHTKQVLYPGIYQLVLEFKPSGQVDKNLLSRQLVPSIDEPEAWAGAKVDIKS